MSRDFMAYYCDGVTPPETRFEFERLHIPTGERSSGVYSCPLPMGMLARVEFYALLNRWNAQQPGVWQYWAKGA